MDGGQSNRDFMETSLTDNITYILKTLLVNNVFDPSKPKIAITMVYSRVMKNILSRMASLNKTIKLYTMNRVISFVSTGYMHTNGTQQ